MSERAERKLVLLPDDDLDFVERSIERGVAAIRQGRDVYFRHVRARPPRDATGP